MEDGECVICLDEQVKAELKTKCCIQSCHLTCLKQWIRAQERARSKKTTCPYCRREMTLEDLSRPQADTWKDDQDFVREVKRLWGDRAFWCKNGKFYGELDNGYGEKRICHFLDKKHVISRIKTYLSF